MLLDTETIAEAREEERSVREVYDRVPYPSASQHRTHPDGSRERSSLVRRLEWEVVEGRLDLIVDGKPVEPERRPAVLEALLDQQLRKMAEHALLVG